MKTRIMIEAEVKFTVEYFEPTEGGMDSDQFGGEFDTVEQALPTLREATLSKPDREWLIVGRARMTSTKVS